MSCILCRIYYVVSLPTRPPRIAGTFPVYVVTFALCTNHTGFSTLVTIVTVRTFHVAGTANPACVTVTTV